MTSFPGSPKVLKGAIVGVDVFNPVASVAIFQYNPEQISRSITPAFSEAGGGRAEPLRLSEPPAETISANLSIDLIDQMEKGDAGPLGAGITDAQIGWDTADDVKVLALGHSWQLPLDEGQFCSDIQGTKLKLAHQPECRDCLVPFAPQAARTAGKVRQASAGARATKP